MRKLRGVLSSAVVLVALLGLTAPSSAVAATAPAPGSWPMSHYNPARSSYNPAETKLNSNTLGSLKLQHSFTMPTVTTICPGPNFHRPLAVVGGNTMYAIAGNYLAAYNLTDGTRRWRHLLDTNGAAHYWDLAVSGGRVFVASSGCPHYGDGKLRAFSASNGAAVWTAKAANRAAVYRFAISGSRIITATRAFGEDFAPSIWVTDPATGKTVWDGSKWAACGDVLVVAGIVPLCRFDDAADQWILEGVSVSDGHVVWTKPSGWTTIRGDTDSASAKDLYATDPADRLTALDPRTGTVKWTRPGPGEYPVVVGKHRLIISCDDDPTTWCALSRADGSLLWKVDVAGGSTAVIAADVFYNDSTEDPRPRLASTGAVIPVSADFPNLSGDKRLIVAGGRMIVTQGRVIKVYALP